jgi:hypothetical protein
MSQAQPQPLSTLAPEYINQLQPQQLAQPIPLSKKEDCPKKPECPPKKEECPKKPECPPKKEECHKKPECPPKKEECPKKPECPPKKEECPKKPECPPKKEECDPCAKNNSGYGWGWLGALILWFIIFTVLFWLIYYSLKPSFVLQNDSNQVDTAKVLLASVISALILVIIIWLIKAAIARRY